VIAIIIGIVRSASGIVLGALAHDYTLTWT
jgi:hypothetical protein